MSDTLYSTAVWSAVTAPHAWDAGGSAFAGAEQAFNQFGELVSRLGRLNNGNTHA